MGVRGMTAILKDLRSLKAARDRGEITPEQYARAEMVLHGMVEEAVLDVEPVPDPPPNRAARGATARAPASEQRPASIPAPAGAWETALMLAAGLAALTMLFALLIGSITLALTLLVTLIAAGTVWALKHFDE